MAQKGRDDQLFDLLRARGLRKRAARIITDATQTGRSAGGEVDKRARAAVKDLRSLADEIEDRLKGGPAKRQAAAQKAARTRAAAARKRSASAKKAAQTRAKTTRTRAKTAR